MRLSIPLERIQRAGCDAWPTDAVNTRRVHVLTHIIPRLSSVALCGLEARGWAIDCQLGNGAATCWRCCVRFIQREP